MPAKSLLVSALAAVAFAADENDRVFSVPDMATFDTYPLYSGYLQAQPDKFLHYMFVESQSNPATDNLIIWFNGGPGCSSMLGFAQEHGPYQMMSGTNYWQINNWSWNREANMLYIEAPAGVGYSYCTDLNACNSYSDQTTATDNLNAVLDFFTKFPEFGTNDLYISGESYAGIYVPWLTQAIDDYNTANAADDTVFKPNLRGFMVGNGVTNYDYDCTPAYVEMGYWHSLYSTAIYDQMKANNCNYGGFSPVYDSTCADLLDQFNTLTQDVNVYDIFGICYGLGPYPQLYNGEHGFTASDYTPFLKGSLSLPPCTFGTPIEAYFNRQDVKDALHISPDAPEWKLCSTRVGLEYQSDSRGSQFIYEALLGKYRMLHYSGDIDGAVPTIGTQNWIASLGWPVVSYWNSYLVDGQVGGYWESYQGDFTFGTVHGAGHMAPQFKPPQTYYLIFNWINGTL